MNVLAKKCYERVGSQLKDRAVFSDLYNDLNIFSNWSNGVGVVV